MLLKHSTVISFFTALFLMPLLFIVASGSNESSSEDASKTVKSGEAGHGFIGFQTGYYYNDDSNDGNPFLDEQLRVIEPVIIYDYNVTDNLSTWGIVSYDDVSSASIERLNNLRGTQQTGASGDYYYGMDAGFKYDLNDRLRIGGFLSGSKEFDYDSFGFGGDISTDSEDKNKTVKFSFNSYLDQIKIIRFNGAETEGKDDRVTISSTINWYQIINPKTHSELGLTLTFQKGFLETAYNAVVIEAPALLGPNPALDNLARGLEIPEALPDSRVRGALFGRIRRFIKPKSSIEFFGRLYTDSWEITSITTEPSLLHWIRKDTLSARLKYRFYAQTASEFYDDHFYLHDFTTSDFINFKANKNKGYATQDSDLADLNSHTFGLQFNWYITQALLFDIFTDYILRSDNIDQTISGMGLTYKF